MARRYKIGKAYVVRRKDGTFKKWTMIGKSLRSDRKTVAKNCSKSGYGHQGDRSCRYSNIEYRKKYARLK